MLSTKITISDAKEALKNTVLCYLDKDEFGNYLTPVEAQNPIFLKGPPGIGKTEIVSQVAAELGLGLVTYSMTHHTRQSALGLPVVKEHNYGNQRVNVTEYTMSEIIADIYKMMAETGLENGILFLDEANCVSETLNPVMLRFLQQKYFGEFKVPEGWIIVTAGNPTEFNKSAKEWDAATKDRVRPYELVPDFESWKKFAYENRIHPAIIAYLDTKPKSFYCVENSVDGQQIVTARGWTNLSKFIKRYEDHGFKLGFGEIAGYIQHDKIAHDFYNYYLQYQYRKNSIDIKEIFSGNSQIKKGELSDLGIDEQYSIISIISDALTASISKYMELNIQLHAVKDVLKAAKPKAATITGPELRQSFTDAADNLKKQIEIGSKANTLSPQKRHDLQLQILTLTKFADNVMNTEPFKNCLAEFNKLVDKLDSTVKTQKQYCKYAFNYISDGFGKDSQGLLLFLTEICESPVTASFLNKYTIPEYLDAVKNFNLGARNIQLNADIDSAIDELDEKDL